MTPGDSDECLLTGPVPKTNIYRFRGANGQRNTVGILPGIGDMELRCEKVQGVQIVHINGRIDSATAEKFGHDIDTLLGSSDQRFVLDLTDLQYINSAGLRVLLAMAKSVKKRGGRCVLCGLSEGVRNVIELAGFHRILKISPTLDDALLQW